MKENVELVALVYLRWKDRYFMISTGGRANGSDGVIGNRRRRNGDNQKGIIYIS